VAEPRNSTKLVKHLNIITELRGDGVADALPDLFGTDFQLGADSGHVGDLESASSATVPSVDAVDSFIGESVLALYQRLSSVQDNSTSWSLRELLCRQFWGWNASQ
jgi:hypothetical protein